MDTLEIYNGNTTGAARLIFNFSVAIVAFFAISSFQNPPIMADGLMVAHAPVPVSVINKELLYNEVKQEVNREEKIEKFNKKVNERYPKSTIRTIETGVKHITLTKIYDGKPVRINVVEIDRSLADNYTLKPTLSSENATLSSKKQISTIAKNNNAIVAINGTFFKPQSGIPLGTLMIDGKLYTGPIYNRVALGIFENEYKTARVEFNGKLKNSVTELKIDNINQPRMLSSYVLVYTRDWGTMSPPTPKYGYQIAVKNNKIISSSYNPLVIPEGGYVIVAPLRSLKPFLDIGSVQVEISTSPDWKDVKHIISGGPYLVKNSDIYVDMTDEKLSSIGGKNPRTAIGYTKENTLIMVTVDGRENHSAGMTLMQLANFMKATGCINAINLDGGGSTVMYVNGQVVNNPVNQGGIAISNALILAKK